MKKSNLTTILIMLTLLIVELQCTYSQDANTASSIKKRKLFPERTSDIFLPFRPKLILLSGVESNSEMTALTIGAELPIGKATTLTCNFGYGYEGEYEYDDASASLSTAELNFFLSSEIKFYFKPLNKRTNWFLSSGFYYSHANYEGTHTVQKNYVYSPGFWFIIPWPGSWTPQDVHQNNFEIVSTNLGFEMNLGWQAILLNRIPCEFKTGFITRQVNTETINFEKSDPNPNYSTSLPDYPALLPLISFKIGYLLYKEQ